MNIFNKKIAFAFFAFLENFHLTNKQRTQRSTQAA